MMRAMSNAMDGVTARLRGWCSRVVLVLVALGSVALVGCQRDEADASAYTLGFEDWMPRYNQYIEEWLVEQVTQSEQRKQALQQELNDASDDAVQTRLQGELESVERELAKLEFRQEIGEYFSVKSEADLPQGLDWQDGKGVPEMGDPRAIKGGTLNRDIRSFPATVRRFGKNANHSFRGELYDNIGMGLVGRHPITEEFFGILAESWAISEDGRTVYYKLRKEATYSDGVPVVARDYLVFSYLRLSDNVKAPFFKSYLREQYANFTSYGDHALSVTLPEAKPLMPLFASVSPAPSHFYQEYGPDFVQRYQWRVEPTTGAYTVREGDIQKGRSIKLSRVKDWWAKDLPQLKYGYNVDYIIYHVIQDDSKSFELFRVGKLDYYPVSQPELWYEKTEIEPVFQGYIEKATFYNIYPRVPRGFYLNVIKAPLDDLDVRVGFAYAMHVQKVIDALFRGDYDRLESFSEGYGSFTNDAIRARRFSIGKAREHFAQAGYTTAGSDGILRNAAGERLEIEVTFPNVAFLPKMMAIFREEAHKCGLDLVLDGQEATLSYKKTMEKLHMVNFGGWGVTPPFPRYHQFFHSSNAFGDDGKPRAQTNNLNSYADPRMDHVSMTVRNARTEDELREAALEAQQIVHDEVLFVPTYVSPYRRVAYWRWLQWPNSEWMEFADPKTYDPLESYYYWIDDSVKQETLKAKRTGQVFPEQIHVFDRYRNGIVRDEAAREEGADE
ncbi:extracellular solute-binding protein [Rubritalea marina]|uniref:extracellular solute-binding protein n=1 Tax=Rubritalea marina TaxID=361055 RepID=UPI0003750EB6|nr:ABC transporter substrate-binding protein [Rubritalea marina]